MIWIIRKPTLPLSKNSLKPMLGGVIMWRPEGWENLYPEEGLALPENIPWIVIHEAFEAGANAMLEALRSNSNKGCLTFIPNDLS